MRETLDPWPFVFGAYGVALIALALLVIWSYRSMRSAEARRDKLKGKKRR